jgi:hypothetical protein
MSPLPNFAIANRAKENCKAEEAQTNMKTESSLLTLGTVLALTITSRGADIIPAEARAIAKEAYLDDFWPVDNYRAQHVFYTNYP